MLRLLNRARMRMFHSTPLLITLLITLLLPLPSLSSPYSISALSPSSTSHLSLTPDPTSACHNGRGHTSILLTPLITSSSLPPSPSRRTFSIKAIPLSSPTTASLHCDVFIDHIHSLTILTSTRQISLGSNQSSPALETLSVQAHDQANNVFSTVEGLPFEWVSSDEGVLAIRGLKESGVNVSTRLIELEEERVTSSLIVVQGVTSGRAKVTVEWKGGGGVESVKDEVDLVVQERLILKPDRARVSPASSFATLPFTRVVDRSSGLSSERSISLPSPLYYFTSDGAGVLSVDRERGVVVGLMEGVGRVVMQDKNLDEHQERAEVEVVKVGQLTASLVKSGTDRAEVDRAESRELGKEGWTVKDGSTYTIVVRMKDEQGRVMDIAPNNHIRIAVEGDSVTPSSTSISSLSSPSTSSFSVVDITARSVGRTVLQLTLDPVMDKTNNVSYSSSARLLIPITVTSPVTVSPTTLLLPVSSSPQPFPLILQGGRGQYHLTSSSPAVISTTHSSITPLTPGHAIITVTDSADPDNFATSHIEAAFPSPLTILPGRREVLKGEEVELVVKVTDTEGRPFDDCSSLELDVEQVGDSFVGEEWVRGARCEDGQWTVKVKGRKVGRSGFTLSVKDVPSTSSKVLLTSFDEMRFGEGEYVVGVGGSGVVGVKEGPITPPQGEARLKVSVYQVPGGKEGWAAIEDGVKRVSEGEGGLPASLKEMRGVKVSSQSTPGRGGLRESVVSCEKGSEGEWLVVADLSHSPSPSLPSPVHSRAFTWLACVPPLTLSPSSLSLSIGETTQLTPFITSTTTPHPLSSSLTFTSSSPSVTVTSSGLVRASALGRALVRAILPRSYWTNDTLQSEVRVEVKFEQFVVKVGGRGVVEGRGVVAHVEGKNGEVPGDEVMEGVEVEWRVKGEGVSLLPLLSYSPALPLPSPTHSVLGYSVMIVGRTEGNHSISALVTIGPPLSPTPSTLTYTLTIEVVKPLTLGPSLLLPFGGQAPLPRLESSHPLTYRLLPSPSPFTVTPSSVIASPSSRSIEDATLLLSSLTAGEIQSTSLALSLRPVRQLIIHSSGLSRWLCVGERYEVEVKAADGLGRVFDGDKEWTVEAGAKKGVKVEVKGRRVTMTAVESGSSVVKVRMKGEDVSPLYLHLFIAPSSSCPTSPSAALLTFHFPLSYSSYPLKTQKRRDLITSLTSDLTSSLSLPSTSVHVLSIDPTTEEVKVVITPQTNHHPHQWFMNREGEVEVMNKAEAVKDETGKWRRTRTGKQVLSKRGIHVTSVPLDVESWPSLDSVWTDEREVNDWERSHTPVPLLCPTPSPSPLPPSPPSPPSNTTHDPYDELAQRIHDSFHTPPSPLTSLLTYLLTCLALIGGGVWMWYWMKYRGEKFPPSFGLWVRDGVEGWVRGGGLVAPVKGSEVGQGVHQRAHVMVG